MKTSLYRASGLACALLTTTVIAAPAAAQEVPRTPPPSVYTLSRGGVDLQSGTYVYNNEDLSIGGPHLAGGISLVRSYATSFLTHAASPLAFGDFDHSLNIRLWIERYQTPEYPNVSQWDWRANVQIGTAVKSFTRSGASSTTKFKLEGGMADSKLDWSSGSPYVYTDREGTVYTFRNPADGCSDSQCGYVSSVVALSGERLDFNYSSNPTQLRSVVSNRGYAMIFENEGLNGRVSKVCAVNRSVQYHDGLGACPAGARAATYSYGEIAGYPGSTFGYTEPGGGGTHAYGPGKFFRPGLSTPYLSLQFGARSAGETSAYEVVRQDFADGDWITYSYGPAGDVFGKMTRGEAVVTDPSGTITATFKEANTVKDGQHYYFVSRGPTSVTDQLGRTTLNDFDVCMGDPCINGDVKSTTLPEGNSIHYAYYGVGNVSEARRKAKPGSGLPDLVEAATFDFITQPNQHPNWGLHYKPTSYTDANGNRFDFTYDTTHGGLLTETGPAVNGVRPQKRYSYVQRYGYVKNSAGTLVQAASPVWVLSQVSECQTQASCSGGADEVRTVYEYASGAVSNALLPRGVLVTGNGVSARTCRRYDEAGRQIADTGAGANLSSCPS